MGIRLGRAPLLDAPAHQRLVDELRALLARARFTTLTQLGARLRPPRGRTWLSDLCQGNHLPDDHELQPVVAACDPTAWPALRVMLHAARAEASARKAATPARLGDHAVTGPGAGWPVVAGFVDWAALGVHRPITRLHTGQDLTARLATTGLPTYVTRETDLAPDGLRATLAAAATGTGTRFVLISGDSTAGKTRAALEAMRAVLSTWRLLLPHSAADLKTVLDQHPDLRHVVVWCDEVQDLLLDTVGVAQLTRLLAGTAGPTVVLGTVRTDRERTLHDSPGWDLLDRRARRIVLYRRPAGAEFGRELARARELADPWIADALAMVGDRYGIAEWLAAGPQLVRALDRARTSPPGSVERIGAALVDAAVDCYRGGYTIPIITPLLRAAYPLYLDPTTTAAGPLPDQLIEHGLAWARAPVAGAVGMLEAHRGRGDRAFDYLIGDAARDGGRELNPRLWPVLLHHTTVATLPTITRAAHRHHAPTTARIAESRMTDEQKHVLLAEQGDIAALTTRADHGDTDAAWRVAMMLTARGDIADLTTRADHGDTAAARQLDGLLAEQGDIATLTTRADHGDTYAANLLTMVLGQPGDIAALTSRADHGDTEAALQLAVLLAEQGDITALTSRADHGDTEAALQLAVLLAEQGDITALTSRADHSDTHAAWQLASLLANQGDLATLTARADHGDTRAAEVLTMLLSQRGDIVALTSRADHGDTMAAWQLADLLAKQGDIAALTTRADHSDTRAAIQLARLWGEVGDRKALAGRAQRGDAAAARELTGLSAARGVVATWGEE